MLVKFPGHLATKETLFKQQGAGAPLMIVVNNEFNSLLHIKSAGPCSPSTLRGSAAAQTAWRSAECSLMGR